MQFSYFGDDSTQPEAFLPFVKLHLRIEPSGSETGGEDALLMLYVCAAFEYIRQFTRSDWPTDSADVPAEFAVAALLLVADLYENREAQNPVALSQNKTVERLLWPHRVF